MSALDSQFELGKLYCDRGDFDKAIEHLTSNCNFRMLIWPTGKKIKAKSCSRLTLDIEKTAGQLRAGQKSKIFIEFNAFI